MNPFCILKIIAANTLRFCRDIYVSIRWGMLDLYSYVTREFNERKLSVLAKLFVGAYLNNWTEAYTKLLMFKLDKNNYVYGRQEELAVVLIYLASYDNKVNAEELLSKNNVVTLLVKVLQDSLEECKLNGAPTSKLHKNVRETVTATVDKIIKENHPNSLSLARHKDFYVDNVTLVLDRVTEVTDTPLKRSHCKRMWMYLN